MAFGDEWPPDYYCDCHRVKCCLSRMACRLVGPGVLINQGNSARGLSSLLVSKEVGKHAQSNDFFFPPKIARGLHNWLQISRGQKTNWNKGIKKFCSLPWIPFKTHLSMAGTQPRAPLLLPSLSNKRCLDSRLLKWI